MNKTMQRIIREREEGQRHAGPIFKEVVYERSLPTIRKTGTLQMHTGCVNHISFSESGARTCVSPSTIDHIVALNELLPQSTMPALYRPYTIRVMQATHCSVGQTTQDWASGMWTLRSSRSLCGQATMPTSSAPGTCLAQVLPYCSPRFSAAGAIHLAGFQWMHIITWFCRMAGMQRGLP